jgi:hypothetical protein
MYSFPKELTSIHSHLNLKHITFPDNLETIKTWEFKDCTELTSVTFPDNLKTIEFWAFKGCTGLTSVTLPDNLEFIGESAFEGCTGLTSVTFPDNLLTIGKNAFKGCTGLKYNRTIDEIVKDINLKKEYECKKLYLEVESNNMKSFQLYKEYYEIKMLYFQYKPFKIKQLYNPWDPKYNRHKSEDYRDVEDLRFVNYFTKSKINQLQNELESIIKE